MSSIHTQVCERCRYVGPDFVWVHGHFQCPKCNQVGDGDCCQGEVCQPPIKLDKEEEK